MPSTRVDAREELGERDPVLGWEVTPEAVDVLAQERHLANALRSHSLGLRDQLRGLAASLAAPSLGHDAVGADAVAALRDLKPSLELALALVGQVAGEVLELEIALSRQRVGGQELGQPVDLSGTEGDVDEWEPLEDLVLHRLGPAATHTHHPLGPLALQPLGLAEMGGEPVVGRLANRAGVEEDEIGVGALRRFGIAERLQHPAHALGIVLVHLAPERRDVVRRHWVRVTAAT